MEKNEKPEDWQLIVNGKSKPWPVADYMNNPVTIDLNWVLIQTYMKRLL